MSVFSVLAKENGDDTALCRLKINPKTVWRSIFPHHTQPYVFSALAKENGDDTALQTTLLHFFSDNQKVLQVQASPNYNPLTQAAAPHSLPNLPPL